MTNQQVRDAVWVVTRVLALFAVWAAVNAVWAYYGFPVYCLD